MAYRLNVDKIRDTYYVFYLDAISWLRITRRDHLRLDNRARGGNSVAINRKFTNIALNYEIHLDYLYIDAGAIRIKYRIIPP